MGLKINSFKVFFLLSAACVYLTACASTERTQYTAVIDTKKQTAKMDQVQSTDKDHHKHNEADEHQHHQHMHAMPDNDPLEYSDLQHAVTQISRDGNYRFTLYSKATPIPMKKIHSWIIKVEDKEGKPVEGVKLFVFGGMPQHRHGFSTKPIVKKYLGDGKYLVEGIKFTMPGYWEMRFNIKEKRVSDRVIFKIYLR